MHQLGLDLLPLPFLWAFVSLFSLTLRINFEYLSRITLQYKVLLSTGSCKLETWSQFLGGRKLECPEKTLEVRLRSTETQSTCNIVVEVEGVIDVHCASLTSQGVKHRVFYQDGHPSRYQPCPTGLNFGEQTGTGVSFW